MRGDTILHLSLGGEVGPEDRVRGPWLSCLPEGPLTLTLSPRGRGDAGAEKTTSMGTRK
jgi:hypothetical protein